MWFLIFVNGREKIKMNKKTLILIIVILSIIIIGMLGYTIFNSKKSATVNLKELIEDIESIRESGEIVNAKEKEQYSTPSTYYGHGYSITVSLGGDCTDYFIYSNNKEIWHYTKIIQLREGEE